ncbi:MAG: hypothetical protein AAGJ79_11380 [Verrucomicrobiota bacterium]
MDDAERIPPAGGSCVTFMIGLSKEPQPDKDGLAAVHSVDLPPEKLALSIALRFDFPAEDQLALAYKLTSFLNEFDEHAVKEWIAVDETFPENVAEELHWMDASLPVYPKPEGSTNDLAQLLCQRGSIILTGQLGAEECLNVPDVFVAFVCKGATKADSRFHIAVDTRAVKRNCLIPILGGAFLEWAECRRQRASAP